MFPADRFAMDGRGLGDDAFLFGPEAGTWIATSDASSEGVHYRLDWTTPERALRKALLANLSDVNAMGGRSRYALFNLGARREWDDGVFVALGRCLRNLEHEWGFRMAGGDTVTAAGNSFFAFTVLGQIAGRPLLRSQCAPGHRIFVTGVLGASAAGLSLLQAQGPEQPEPPLITAHFDPAPPLQLGPALSESGKTVAAIDISDGLSSELWHLSRRSGCALRVEWSKLPIAPALQTGWEPEKMDLCVLHGGEEYQLLFTGEFSADELQRLRRFAAIAEIGEVEKGSGVFLARDGKTEELPAGGYSHA